METERPVGVPFFKTFLNQNLNWYITLHMRSYICLGIYSGEQRLTHMSPIAESMWIHFDCQHCHICLLKCLYFLWKEVLLFSVWLFKSVILRKAVQLLYEGEWNLCQPPRVCHRDACTFRKEPHEESTTTKTRLGLSKSGNHVGANAFIIWLPSYV